MDRYYNCFGLCSELEVDYDKEEVRAKYRDCWGEHVLSRDFGVITHYEFEYVKTEWVESDKDDCDSRDHLIQLRETMCVSGSSKNSVTSSPKRKGLPLCDMMKLG